MAATKKIKVSVYTNVMTEEPDAIVIEQPTETGETTITVYAKLKADTKGYYRRYMQVDRMFATTAYATSTFVLKE